MKQDREEANKKPTVVFKTDPGHDKLPVKHLVVWYTVSYLDFLHTPI